MFINAIASRFVHSFNFRIRQFLRSYTFFFLRCAHYARIYVLVWRIVERRLFGLARENGEPFKTDLDILFLFLEGNFNGGKCRNLPIDENRARREEVSTAVSAHRTKNRRASRELDPWNFHNWRETFARICVLGESRRRLWSSVDYRVRTDAYNGKRKKSFARTDEKETKQRKRME